jgi:hypothetical protein
MWCRDSKGEPHFFPDSECEAHPYGPRPGAVSGIAQYLGNHNREYGTLWRTPGPNGWWVKQRLRHFLEPDEIREFCDVVEAANLLIGTGEALPASLVADLERYRRSQHPNAPLIQVISELIATLKAARATQPDPPDKPSKETIDPPAPSEQRKEVGDELTDDELVNELRSLGKAEPAALVEFMKDKKFADYDTIKEKVHGNPTVSDEAVRKLIERTNKAIQHLAWPFTFRTASGLVVKESVKSQGSHG